MKVKEKAVVGKTVTVQGVILVARASVSRQEIVAKKIVTVIDAMNATMANVSERLNAALTTNIAIQDKFAWRLNVKSIQRQQKA